MFKKGRLSKKILPIAVMSAVALGSIMSIAPDQDVQAGKGGKVKNVIFLIGDGMGVSYTSAYRYFKDNPKTPGVEETAFDPNLVGQQMTYPEDPSENITDSASAATAMSAGVKTYNAAIAVDNDKKEVKTDWKLQRKKAKRQDLSQLLKLPMPHRLHSVHTMRPAKI
jgi:alkaline phosphatase